MTKLFDESPAALAGYELMIVKRADVEEVAAMLRELGAQWRDDYMWEEFHEVHCRYCDVAAAEHPYDNPDADDVTVTHDPGCVIARVEALLARLGVSE